MNFNTDVSEVFRKATRYAEMDMDKYIRPSHVLLSILRYPSNKNPNNIIIYTLESMNVDIDVLEEMIIKIRTENVIKQTSDKHIKIVYSSDLQNILDNANNDTELSINLNQLMESIINTQNELSQVLIDNLIQIEFFKEVFSNVQDYYSQNIGVYEEQDSTYSDTDYVYSTSYEDNYIIGENAATPESNNSKVKNSYLNSYARNLNEEAKNGDLDPCIDREDEILLLQKILLKRKRKNPILVGKSGVGKTAIVHELARRIASGDVIDELKNKTLFQFSMLSCIAGTMYRGQFEERVKKILTELKQNENFILLIDEIHTIIGTGSAEGSLDFSNSLKEDLADGKIQIIGITTLQEYKPIRKDKALARRLQAVHVKEPNVESVKTILKNSKNLYESRYNIHFSDENLLFLIKMADLYIHSQASPAREIDLLDNIGANIKMKYNRSENLKKIHLQLKTLDDKKKKIISTQNFELAYDLNLQHHKLVKEIKECSLENRKKATTYNVTNSDIVEAIEEQTNIPIKQQDRTFFIEKYKNITSKVISQDEIVKKVLSRLLINNFELDDNRKSPIGKFIFLGTTGVGKTELAKQLAFHFFGNKNSLIKIDCSEYQDKTSIYNLIGGPKGHVGYDDGGILTEYIINNPYCVVLLDEIEKAHSSFHKILLQILEDGTLTDTQGNVAIFKNSLIIMTSNLGAKKIQQKSLGYINTDENNIKYESELKRFFDPEFLNRIDDILIFNKISKKALRQIFDNLFTEFKSNLKEKGYDIEISENTISKIIEKYYSEEYGVRPLINKGFEKHIKTPVIYKIQSDDLINNKIVINFEDAELDFYEFRF